MTKDEALKLALKFVEDTECGTADLEAQIKEALAQPEPVAFFNPQKGSFYWAKPTKVIPPVTVDVKPLPLYTSSSPQRTWTGLTKNEVETLSYTAEGNTWIAVELAEAKLKEKNT